MKTVLKKKIIFTVLAVICAGLIYHSYYLMQNPLHLRRHISQIEKVTSQLSNQGAEIVNQSMKERKENFMLFTSKISQLKESLMYEMKQDPINIEMVEILKELIASEQQRYQERNLELVIDSLLKMSDEDRRIYSSHALDLIDKARFRKLKK